AAESDTDNAPDAKRAWHQCVVDHSSAPARSANDCAVASAGQAGRESTPLYYPATAVHEHSGDAAVAINPSLSSCSHGTVHRCWAPVLPTSVPTACAAAGFAGAR